MYQYSAVVLVFVLFFFVLAKHNAMQYARQERTDPEIGEYLFWTVNIFRVMSSYILHEVL